MTENRANLINGEKPEFGNSRHIQFVNNQETDAQDCMGCAEKLSVIRSLNIQIAEMERVIKTLCKK
jgi:hypothetical protein